MSEALRSPDNRRWCITSDGLVVFFSYPAHPIGPAISVWKPSREWHATPATPLQVPLPPKTHLLAMASAGTRVLALMDEDMRGESGLYQFALSGDSDQPLRRLATVPEIATSPSAHSVHSATLGHVAVFHGESSVLVCAPDRPDAARQFTAIEIGAPAPSNPVASRPTPTSVAAIGSTLLVCTSSNSLTVIDLQASPPAVRTHCPTPSHRRHLSCVAASVRLQSPTVAILLAMFADGQVVVEAIGYAGAVLWHKELRDTKSVLEPHVCVWALSGNVIAVRASLDTIACIDLGVADELTVRSVRTLAGCGYIAVRAQHRDRSADRIRPWSF